MNKCQSCVINNENCCDECAFWNTCEKVLNSNGVPDSYPKCWICNWLKDGKCINKT